MHKRRGQLKKHWWLLIPILVGIAVFWWLFGDLPSPGDLSAYTSAPSSKIYDRNGRLLYEMPAPYTGSHTPVGLDQIPLHLQQAIIALEDRNFYSNPGFDIRGIFRAVRSVLNREEQVVGGSTITQQLARLLLIPEERYEITVRRKLREIYLAARITLRYSKDEILSYYLNEVYFGNMAYGAEAAAQLYYSKHIEELDLAECAMLASLPNAPIYGNPLENYEVAKSRQELTLDRMIEEGFITTAQARDAKAEKLYFASAEELFSIRAPHFVMLVRNQLEQDLGLDVLNAGGLDIHTTLDVDLNEAIRDSMRYRLELLANCFYDEDCPPGGHNVRNAAVVVMDPHTGEVIAMVGSPDYFSARIDGAVNGSTALRQPGSSIKPITYAAAFDSGTMTPATVMLDIPTSFVTKEGDPYVPRNYDLTFRGPVRLREALASSYNLVAVKVLDEISIETMIDQARDMGISTLDDPEKQGLALTLGGGEVQLLELTTAYAAFANSGYAMSPVMIDYVSDGQGDIIWQTPCYSESTCYGQRVLDDRTAWLITDVLSDDLARVPTFGEGSVLDLPNIAVKTGTTTDFRDNWTMGYSTDLVVGVWVGNADNESMLDVSGVTGAAPIWRDAMELSHERIRANPMERPPGLVDVEICALSGLLPGPECTHRMTETFIEGTQPLETCDWHQRINGTLYTIYPPEARSWAIAQGIPQAPIQTDDEQERDLTIWIAYPVQGAVFHIDKSTNREAQQLWLRAETASPAARVDILVNGTSVGVVTSEPYEVFWQLTPGIHTISAVYFDQDNHSQYSDPITIEVIE